MTLSAGASVGIAGALLRASRPKQWVKNGLVFAAPLAAGTITHRAVAGHAAVAFAAFTLLASGTYLLNDVRDVADDRVHPRKRLRPIAAGELSVPLAVGVGVGLIAAGLAVAAALGWEFLAIAAGYATLTSLYSLWLRSIEVIDIAAVAGGFVLRAAAGGAAADVHLSPWFLIVTSFAALFIVAGKRLSEQELGEPSRVTLAVYPTAYLRGVCTLAATVATSAYCVWAFSRPSVDQLLWAKISVIPFAIALLRYGLLIELGRAGAPEETFLADRTLLLLAGIWAAIFAAGALQIG